MPTFNEVIFSLQDKDIFISSEPEILDFTCDRVTSYKLHISSIEYKIDIPFSLEKRKLQELLSKLECFLGNENSIIITWKLKNILSYCKGKTGVNLDLKGRIFDLAYLEGYLDINLEKPKTFAEAKKRLENLLNNKRWNDVYKMYTNVIHPLMYTLPEIETYPLLNKSKKKKVYSYYEINGQINGRLKAVSVFENSFNPHNSDTEEKKNLIPLSWGDKEYFVFDYKHMEVSVLAWLSQDRKMKEILDSGADFYEACWNLLVPNVLCNARHRKTCKEFFLPIVYGLGSESLSKKISWPLVHSKKLVEDINNIFSTAMSWIKEQQNNTFEGKAYDYFSRCRSFDNSYKIRNFSIQSPAAIICLHKLTELSKKIKNCKICMHIHDGYVIIGNKSEFVKIYNDAKSILESEDDLYRGLKLTTACKHGSNFDNLISLKGGL